MLLDQLAHLVERSELLDSPGAVGGLQREDTVSLGEDDDIRVMGRKDDLARLLHLPERLDEDAVDIRVIDLVLGLIDDEGRRRLNQKNRQDGGAALSTRKLVRRDVVIADFERDDRHVADGDGLELADASGAPDRVDDPEGALDLRGLRIVEGDDRGRIVRAHERGQVQRADMGRDLADELRVPEVRPFRQLREEREVVRGIGFRDHRDLDFLLERRRDLAGDPLPDGEAFGEPLPSCGDEALALRHGGVVVATPLLEALLDRFELEKLGLKARALGDPAPVGLVPFHDRVVGFVLPGVGGAERVGGDGDRRLGLRHRAPDVRRRLARDGDDVRRLRVRVAEDISVRARLEGRGHLGAEPLLNVLFERSCGREDGALLVPERLEHRFLAAAEDLRRVGTARLLRVGAGGLTERLERGGDGRKIARSVGRFFDLPFEAMEIHRVRIELPLDVGDPIVQGAGSRRSRTCR